MTNVMLNVIADLLEYPTKWIKRKREIEEIVNNLTSSRAYLLKEFLEEVSNYNELDLEEIYVKTFDNNDYITLNISYYITGEEKNRVNLPKRGLLLV
ncbi:MAG: nitrate reductase molybdenum cofactor assembly chaperone, partial [Metallosphaera sp.]